MLVRNPKPEIHHTQLFTNQEGQTNEDGEEEEEEEPKEEWSRMNLFN